MNLRDRKPLQSPCVVITPEDPKFEFKGPIDEAYISTADTPKIRLNKAKDADNRQLARLEKRLKELTGNADHCTITLQRNFCGLVERCHGMERSESWSNPERMTRLDYFWGFKKPGMLNLDTRRNFWRGAINLHRLGDNGAFAFLSPMAVLKFVRDYAREVRALGDDIDSRRFYEDVLQVVQSPGGTFQYEILPILMDECYPISQKPAQSIGPGAVDTTHVSFHVHPFSTIGVIDLHLNPVFAIVDAWDKIMKHRRKPFWTDEQCARVGMITEIMEIWQGRPHSKFLARKPPAPTPRGQDPNGGRDVRMDYTPSKKGKVNALSQSILGTLAQEGEPSTAPSDGTPQSSHSHVPAAAAVDPSSSGAATSDAPPYRSEKSKGKQRARDDVDFGRGEVPTALPPIAEEDEIATSKENDVDNVFADNRATATAPSAPEAQEDDAGEAPIPTTSAPSAAKTSKRRAPDADQPKAKRANRNAPAAAPPASPVHWTQSRATKEEDKTEEVKPEKGKTKKSRKKKNW